MLSFDLEGRPVLRPGGMERPHQQAMAKGRVLVCLRPLALGLLLGDLGCSSVHEEEGSGSVEIFSWWTNWGEADALEAIIELHEEAHPDSTVVNAAVDFADKAREQLQMRMEAGTPPDLFQANIGADLFNWVLLNGTDDADARVVDLTGLAVEEGWFEVVDPDVLEAASVGGKLYGFPMNVHRINSLFYRKDLFDAYGLVPPTTLEELLTLCAAITSDASLQAESPTGQMACLGLGNKWDWTLSMVTFEMLLPAVAGGRYYESFWRGEEAPDDALLAETLELALELYCGGAIDVCDRSYFSADMGEVDWDVGVRALAQKSAMMAPMGDWAKGYLEAEGLDPDSDFGVVPFPGSQGTFVMTVDTFGLPMGASNRRGALALLRTMASRQGQITFNRLKGSVTPRTDISPSEFDVMTQRVMADFERDDHVRALSGLLPRNVMSELASELRESFERGGTEIISNYIEANYDSLR